MAHDFQVQSRYCSNEEGIIRFNIYTNLLYFAIFISLIYNYITSIQLQYSEHDLT